MSAVKQESQKLTVAHLRLQGTEMVSATFEMFLKPFFNLAKISTLELTRFYYSHIKKMHSFGRTCFFKGRQTIFEISTDIISKTVLTKFQKDWTKNVNVRVLISFTIAVYGQFIRLLADILYQQTITFVTEPSYHINNYWKINVTSREKIVPPPGGNVFQQTGTISDYHKAIIVTHGLTRFNKNWTI
ncbi:hypothetical protein DPMN_164281 [Dreissena polymorpha]|uniref:Uncharacterized protein n=1 Tax=Dreissena polymorpha TaxID=45954 RepID=A0A9D4EVM5_DREPO|nr:hypothetical protein DPMN_164281 [Dreissena polymorpha]